MVSVGVVAQVVCVAVQPVEGYMGVHVDAELHGHGLKYGPGKKTNDYVQDWRSADSYVSWKIRLMQPGRFNVTANYDADSQSEGNSYAVSVDDQSVTAIVKSGTDISQPVGQIDIQAGQHEMRVEAKKLEGGELLRLRSVSLVPIQK